MDLKPTQQFLLRMFQKEHCYAFQTVFPETNGHVALPMVVSEEEVDKRSSFTIE